MVRSSYSGGAGLRHISCSTAVHLMCIAIQLRKPALLTEGLACEITMIVQSCIIIIYIIIIKLTAVLTEGPDCKTTMCMHELSCKLSQPLWLGCNTSDAILYSCPRLARLARLLISNFYHVYSSQFMSLVYVRTSSMLYKIHNSDLTHTCYHTLKNNKAIQKNTQNT